MENYKDKNTNERNGAGGRANVGRASCTRTVNTVGRINKPDVSAIRQRAKNVGEIKLVVKADVRASKEKLPRERNDAKPNVNTSNKTLPEKKPTVTSGAAKPVDRTQVNKKQPSASYEKKAVERSYQNEGSFKEDAIAILKWTKKKLTPIAEGTAKLVARGLIKLGEKKDETVARINDDAARSKEKKRAEKEERLRLKNEQTRTAAIKRQKAKEMRRKPKSILEAVAMTMGRIYGFFVSEKRKTNAEPSGFTRFINLKPITAFLIFLFSIIFLAMSFALVYLIKPLPGGDGLPDKINIVYNFDGNSEKYSVGAASAYRDGDKMYCNFSKAYAGFGFSAMGDVSKMRYTLPNGEYMLLVNESNYAEINGESVALEGKVYITGTDVYIPVSFLEIYCNGVDIYFNTESKTLYLQRMIDKNKSNSIKTVYYDFGLIPEKCKPISPITEPVDTTIPTDTEIEEA